MRRFTTLIETLTIEGIDLTSANIYVTMQQGATKVTYSDNELSAEYDGADTTISIHMTQEQTGSFSEGMISVQVNWMKDGERNATNICRFLVGGNLLDEVIT